MHYIKSWIIFSSLLVITLLLTVSGIGCAQSPEEKPTITLVRFDWSSQVVLVEILDQIISEQLGYPTEQIFLSQPATWPAMDRGDVDLTPEIWLPGRLPEIQPFLDKGNIELAGQIFSGGIGWVVPRYMIEGDPARGIEPMAPDLKTILDIKKYWELFENPENPGLGELMGGQPGWVDQPSDLARFKAYDLPLWRSNQSAGVLFARIIAADKKGEPFLSYVWWPHWIFSEVDLVQLEEVDPYDDDAYQAAVAGELDELKSRHPAYDIQKVVRVELADTAPDVYRLMHNLVLSPDEVDAIMLRVDVDEEEASAVAADWISQNQSRIDQWLGK